MIVTTVLNGFTEVLLVATPLLCSFYHNRYKMQGNLNCAPKIRQKKSNDLEGGTLLINSSYLFFLIITWLFFIVRIDYIRNGGIIHGNYA